MSNHIYNYLRAHKQTPVIFIILDDASFDNNIFAMRKIQEKIPDMIPVIVSDVKDKSKRDFLSAFSEDRAYFVPKSGYMSALLCVLPLQRLAYDFTIALGYDPDRPRNLAKELTTK